MTTRRELRDQIARALSGPLADACERLHRDYQGDGQNVTVMDARNELVRRIHGELSIELESRGDI